GGAIHEELAGLLGDGRGRDDVLFFGCVGNTAQRHWCGAFRAGPAGWHEWVEGQTDNPLAPWGDERVMVELYCGPGATYEVSVVDASTGAEAARATSRCAGACCTAAVRFTPQSGHRYRARVRLVTGTPGRFHLVALHSGLEFTTPGGSICF